MQFDVRARVVLGLILSFAALPAAADPITSLVSDAEAEFLKVFVDDESILDAAKTLFVSLATISLVWTMGLHVVRQDLGDALMELLRFMIVTGTFYWLLVNASSHAGGDDFVQRIVGSFYQMANNDSGGAFRVRGDSAVTRALHVYMKVMDDTSTGQDPDRIVGGLMGVMVLVALTLLAAQFLLALVMAWLLGYGGIFLLGFGGARWTSQIAINYYKHVVALGVVILALGVIGQVSEEIFRQIVPSFGVRTKMSYVELGLALTVSLLMLVLGLRVPQLLYTLVTGSSLGMFAGMAGMAGSAIVAGGGAALASAGGRHPKGGGADTTPGLAASVGRSSSAMEAIERSAVSASAMGDPFHVAGGSDPFGASRKADASRGAGGGSVFGAASNASATAAVPGGTSNGGESFDTVTTRSGNLVAAAGSSSATTVPEPTGSTGQPDSGRRADVPEGSSANSIPLAGEREVASRPDYLAEMSAIANARGDGAAHLPAALEQTDHPSQSADVAKKAGENTASIGIASGLHPHPSDESASVTSSLTWHDTGQMSAAAANMRTEDVATQYTHVVTMPTFDSQHGAAAGNGGAVDFASGSSDYRIDAMNSEPADIHQGAERVEQLSSAALRNGGQSADASVADAVLAPPEFDRAEGNTTVHAVTSVNHENTAVASDTSALERTHQTMAIDEQAERPAQQLHAQSAQSERPPTDRPLLDMGSTQSGAIEAGGATSTSAETRSAQNAADEISRARRAEGNEAVRGAEAERAHAESSDHPSRATPMSELPPVASDDDRAAECPSP